jgi:hypothetical protein
MINSIHAKDRVFSALHEHNENTKDKIYKQEGIKGK